MTALALILIDTITIRLNHVTYRFAKIMFSLVFCPLFFTETVNALLLVLCDDIIKFIIEKKLHFTDALHTR